MMSLSEIGEFVSSNSDDTLDDNTVFLLNFIKKLYISGWFNATSLQY